MEKISTIKDLIDLWPTRADLADDVDASKDRVNGWAKAGSIPARYHHAVCESGVRRGFPITAELLDRLHHDAVRRRAA